VGASAEAEELPVVVQANRADLPFTLTDADDGR
jgi:hypothetical protein